MEHRNDQIIVETLRSSQFFSVNEDAVQVPSKLGKVGMLAKAVEIEPKLLIKANDVHLCHSGAALNNFKTKG